jgi:Protein of unknown function (DUF4231)
VAQRLPDDDDRQPFKEYRTLVEKNTVWFRNWYRRRARIVRYCFRVSGILVILFSVSLPLFANLQFGAKDLVISALAVSIAALTGIRNFYQWDHIWRVLKVADFELTFIIAQWELEIQELSKDGDHEAARRQVHEKTMLLFSDTQAIVQNESKQYFGTLTWPDISTRSEHPGLLHPEPTPRPSRPVTDEGNEGSC